LATMPPAPDGAIEVYLNEGDLQRILEIDHSRAAGWNLMADSRLESGECRVKSGNHEADAGCRQRLTACMEQISEQLLPHDEPMEIAA
jgi:flagellar assembly protein FliH